MQSDIDSKDLQLDEMKNDNVKMAQRLATLS